MSLLHRATPRLTGWSSMEPLWLQPEPFALLGDREHRAVWVADREGSLGLPWSSPPEALPSHRITLTLGSSRLRDESQQWFSIYSTSEMRTLEPELPFVVMHICMFEGEITV